MQMDQVRATIADDSAQPRDEREIGIAAHRQRYDLGVTARPVRDLAVLRTGKEILDAALPEPREQVEHLLRATVQLHAGLDVQHPHGGPPGSAQTALITSSGVISRRQVKRP
jgi:hypothetical protein